MLSGCSRLFDPPEVILNIKFIATFHQEPPSIVVSFILDFYKYRLEVLCEGRF